MSHNHGARLTYTQLTSSTFPETTDSTSTFLFSPLSQTYHLSSRLVSWVETAARSGFTEPLMKMGKRPSLLSSTASMMAKLELTCGTTRVPPRGTAATLKSDSGVVRNTMLVNGQQTSGSTYGKDYLRSILQLRAEVRL